MYYDTDGRLSRWLWLQARQLSRLEEQTKRGACVDTMRPYRCMCMRMMEPCTSHRDSFRDFLRGFEKGLLDEGQGPRGSHFPFRDWGMGFPSY
jgi:hypothetical protein